MYHHAPRRWRTALFLAAAAPFVAAAAPPAWAWSDPPAEPATALPAAEAPKFIRSIESEDGRRLRLEMVIRSFVPADGVGPSIDLVGAVHIGDMAFYEQLQAHLDDQDVVLFEGVKPAAVGNADDANDTEEDRVARTRKRIRLIAALAERHKSAQGEYPATIEELGAAADGRIAWLVDSAATDAWGVPLVYTLEPADGGASAKFDVVSLGADATPGGDGPAADIAFSAEPPLTAAERVQDDPGIQQQLAVALGLVFQLDAMDHSGANWRNSDMTIDQLQERLDVAGADAGTLFKTLEGTSLSSRFLGLALRFIGSNPTYSAMGKMMLVEVLSRADQLLEAAPGNMGAMMGVIIHERNSVLLDDLRAVLDTEPGVASIGIIYGAGHLPDIQARLVGEFGYVPAGESWVSAIAVDLDEAGVPPAQARQLRAMIRRTLEQQLRTIERQRAREEQRELKGP